MMCSPTCGRPVPRLATGGKDRITRVLTSEAMTLSAEGKDLDTMIPMLMNSLLEELNGELRAMKIGSKFVSLDVSLDNPAVKLLLAQYRQFADNDPSSPMAVAALSESLKAVSTKLDDKGRIALAKELIKINVFVADLFNLSQNSVANAATSSSEQHMALQRALVTVVFYSRESFTGVGIDIPWSGTSPLRRLIEHSLEPTLADLWAQDYVRFESKALTAAFGERLRLALEDDVAKEEFPLLEKRSGKTGSKEEYAKEECEMPQKPAEAAVVNAPKRQTQSRFVEPPGGEFVPADCTLKARVVNVIIGASGAGKTIAALRMAASCAAGESCFVLYCKGDSVFRTCPAIDNMSTKDRNDAVMDHITTFVKDSATTMNGMRMVLRESRQRTVLRVVVDDMGAHRLHLRALCARHRDICTSLQDAVGIWQVQCLAVVPLTVCRNSDIAKTPTSSDGDTFTVDCAATNPWPVYSAWMRRNHAVTSRLCRFLDLVDEKTYPRGKGERAMDDNGKTGCCDKYYEAYTGTKTHSTKNERDTRLRRLRTALHNARLATLFANKIVETIPANTEQCLSNADLLEDILLSMQDFLVSKNSL